ncbi:MAG TPA: pyridoxal phosphate-dependent aminotransferase [Solirubrobacteraceae bacterium]|jgi:hypothetical protein|nr:pyridoxal phosphate-dependent aminotransferase [Solirubrobacteraceae bacterium]
MGRFPKNEIISLLEVNRRHNLAESTSYDLSLGEIMAMVDADDLKALRLGYGSASGLPQLRELVGRACGVSAGTVLTTQGTALGLFLLAFELCGEGRDAVLAVPSFPPSRDVLTACGARVIEVACQFDECYRLDLARCVDALTPDVRLVSLATPQNPSGVRTPEPVVVELLEAMTEICPEASLFVDETYREAAHGDAASPPSMAALDRRVVTGSSVSKAHGAPGLRVGWLTIQDANLYERLKTAKMNTVISGSVVDETLAAAVLAHQDRLLAQRRSLLTQGLSVLATWHNGERHRLDWVRPDAGALCCMRLRPDAFDAAAIDRFWQVLPDLDLQLASGTWFGEGPEIFRLGFGYLPVDMLREALDTVSTAMDRAAL